jgi:hypothetical protein
MELGAGFPCIRIGSLLDQRGSARLRLGANANRDGTRSEHRMCRIRLQTRCMIRCILPESMRHYLTTPCVPFTLDPKKLG